jgi:hypothetical protein
MIRIRWGFLLVVAGGLAPCPALSADFQVQDLSNRVITCDTSLWFLRSFADRYPGACLVVPDHTLEIAATPDTGAAKLDELHIVALHQGTYYRYNHEHSGGQPFWNSTSLAGVLSAAADPSFTRNFFSDQAGLPTLTRRVYFAEIASLSGAVIYAGVKSAPGPGFEPGDVKPVYTVR